MISRSLRAEIPSQDALIVCAPRTKTNLPKFSEIILAHINGIAIDFHLSFHNYVLFH